MIAKEGLGSIFVVFLFALIVGFAATYLPPVWQYLIFMVLILLCFFILYFFRDPERTIPDSTNKIISPADGKVVQIKRTDESEYLKQESTRISIFLSPLNVHVNRIPLSGKLEYLKYYPGKYLMAWEDHASEENERAHFGVLHESGTKVLFKQITGFLARRIVYHLKEGETVTAGERFGIMKFGSRMDILVPGNVSINVQVGDTTTAGETIIGEIDPE